MARMIDKKTTSDNVLVVLTYLTLGADQSTFERVGVGRPLEKLLQQPFRLKKNIYCLSAEENSLY